MEPVKHESPNAAPTGDGDHRLADAQDAAPPGTDTDVLQAALAAAEAKASEHYDALLRAKAEAENTRRRAQEDVSKAHKFGIENFAEAMLPVMDSLQAALSDATADAHKVREGVELTRRQLQGRVRAQPPRRDRSGRPEIRSASPPGDPDGPGARRRRRESCRRGPAAGAGRSADRVLRPALVTVAS